MVGNFIELSYQLEDQRPYHTLNTLLSDISEIEEIIGEDWVAEADALILEEISDDL
jgi:hypothetical protein